MEHLDRILYEKRLRMQSFFENVLARVLFLDPIKICSFLFLFLHETGLQDQPTRTVHFLRIVRQSYLVDGSLFDSVFRTLDGEILDEEHLISVRENGSVCVFGFRRVHMFLINGKIYGWDCRGK